MFKKFADKLFNFGKPKKTSVLPTKTLGKWKNKMGLKILSLFSGPVTTLIVYILPSSLVGAVIGIGIALGTFFVLKPMLKYIWLVLQIILSLMKLATAKTQQRRIDKEVQKNLENSQHPGFGPQGQMNVPPTLNIRDLPHNNAPKSNNLRWDKGQRPGNRSDDQ